MNEFFKVLVYIGVVFGSATLMSLIGVSVLLFLDHLVEKWKKKK